MCTVTLKGKQGSVESWLKTENCTGSFFPKLIRPLWQEENTETLFRMTRRLPFWYWLSLDNSAIRLFIHVWATAWFFFWRNRHFDSLIQTICPGWQGVWVVCQHQYSLFSMSFCYQGTKLWIIMEYLGGGSALDLVRKMYFKSSFYTSIFHTCKQISCGINAS